MTTGPRHYVAPSLGLKAFTCPCCGAYAEQESTSLRPGSATLAVEVVRKQCSVCLQRSYWLITTPSNVTTGAIMVWPAQAVGPMAHPDMPGEVREIYDEARDISSRSPRGAAALLRLAMQTLVNDLEPGKGQLDEKIGRLVKRGLDPRVQQAMDVVRVIGNNAVHPGEVVLDEDPALVPALFGLVNLVVDQVISQPAHVASLFEGLPDGAIEAIARRDQPST